MRNRRPRRTWTIEEDVALLDAVALLPQDAHICWTLVSPHVPGRSPKDCRKRWTTGLNTRVSRGCWSAEEDALLRGAVQKFGTDWPRVAQEVKVRTGDQCSNRWLDVLDPAIKRDAWTPEEDKRLLDLYQELGTVWNVISAKLTGRRALHCRNRACKLLLQSGQPKPGTQAAEELRLSRLALRRGQCATETDATTSLLSRSTPAAPATAPPTAASPLQGYGLSLGTGHGEGVSHSLPWLASPTPASPKQSGLSTLSRATFFANQADVDFGLDFASTGPTAPDRNAKLSPRSSPVPGYPSPLTPSHCLEGLSAPTLKLPWPKEEQWEDHSPVFPFSSPLADATGTCDDVSTTEPWNSSNRRPSIASSDDPESPLFEDVSSTWGFPSTAWTLPRGMLPLNDSVGASAHANGITMSLQESSLNALKPSQDQYSAQALHCRMEQQRKAPDHHLAPAELSSPLSLARERATSLSSSQLPYTSYGPLTMGQSDRQQDAYHSSEQCQRSWSTGDALALNGHAAYGAPPSNPPFRSTMGIAGTFPSDTASSLPSAELGPPWKTTEPQTDQINTASNFLDWLWANWDDATKANLQAPAMTRN